MPLILLLLAAVASGSALQGAVGHAPPDPLAEKTVYKGKPATQEQLASVVDITFESAKQDAAGYCTGVLIDRNVAATAGHCWQTKKSQKLVDIKPTVVRFLARPGEKRRVVAGAHHESFERVTLVNDVGFVVFAGSPPAGAAPAELLEDESGLTLGREMLFVGHGRDEKGVAPRARATTLSVISTQTGGTLHMSGLPDTGICSGDSGGPLFLEEGGKRLVAALASSSVGADCKGPGTADFALMPRYRAWLLSAARAAQQRLDAAGTARR